MEALHTEMAERAKKMTARREKVAKLLRADWQTATAITLATGYSDPRGYIRDLRDMGVNIADRWIKGDGVRFKQYHIEPKQTASASSQFPTSTSNRL